MKIVYAANIRLPTEKAHGVQIIKMCEAFANAGVDVELVVPRRKNDLTEDPYDYYRVKRNFKITYVRSFYFPQFGRVGFWLESVLFAEQVAYLVWQLKPDVLYSRDELVLANFFLWRVKCVWETHTGAMHWPLKFFIKKFYASIAISKGLADLYVSNGVPREKILVAHDGVDMSQFELTADKEAIKQKLALPLDKKIVLYAGHLYGWKGADTLLQMSDLQDIEDMQVVIIGGTNAEVAELSKKYPKVIFLGYLPYIELPANQKIADVLIIPNSAKSLISRLYTSPLKVFAHMASGVPIVASDIPSIREVLDETVSVLVPPDDPRALLMGIKKVVDSPALGGKLSSEALRRVKLKYTWNIRARAIIDFIHKQA